MRLPGAVAGLFERWLEEHFPDRKEKVLNRVRDLRGGQLYDPRFGNRMRGEGLFADQIRVTFQTFKRRYGLDQPFPELSTAAFRRPGRWSSSGCSARSRYFNAGERRAPRSRSAGGSPAGPRGSARCRASRRAAV